MGTYISRLLNKDMRILMAGLPSSGKTTILYRLKLSETVNTVPTNSFNIERVEYNELSFRIVDVGGTEGISPLDYFLPRSECPQAIVFVVDSTNRNHISSAREKLLSLLASPELHHTPLLVFANKQDVSEVMTVSEIIENLALGDLKGRSWQIQATCATAGDGLYEGLEWLSMAIKHRT